MIRIILVCRQIANAPRSKMGELPPLPLQACKEMADADDVG